jgi:Domain of unknown function (DUF5020)
MKYLFLAIMLLCTASAFSQNLQLHYDLRHTVDPQHNPQNFPTLYFEYFKAMDTTSSFIKPGAFFIKIESDLQGDRDNIGKSFIQASQTFRLWQPKIYAAVQYSGGLGVTDPAQYSYYINNCLSIGPSYPFQWKGAYFNAEVFYNYNIYKRPSNDVMLSFYWGKGFWNYKVELDGDFELYTLNRNQGDAATQNLTGKLVCFFGEPQVWFKVKGGFSMGSKAIMYYHVITTQNLFEVYPTIAARIKF